MVYHVFANKSNIGDWLSAKGIQKLVGPVELTECLCDVPYVDETIKILSRATNNDLIIIGGGGLLMDYFIPFWEAFKPIAKKVPFCIWGIGYCDLKSEITLTPGTLLEEIIKNSKICIVRDELSRSYLPQCDLANPVACPSINAVEPPLSKGAGLLHVVNYSTAGADTYDLMCFTAKKFTKENGIDYRETNNRVKKGNEQEMDHLLSVYSSSNIVLSSALHGCIIGVAMGLKVLAVSGDRKIEAFMEAVGFGDWVLDVADVHLVHDRLGKLHAQAAPTGVLNDIRKKNEKIAENIRMISRENFSNEDRFPGL